MYFNVVLVVVLSSLAYWLKHLTAAHVFRLRHNEFHPGYSPLVARHAGRSGVGRRGHRPVLGPHRSHLLLCQGKSVALTKYHAGQRSQFPSGRPLCSKTCLYFTTMFVNCSRSRPFGTAPSGSAKQMAAPAPKTLQCAADKNNLPYPRCV